MRKNLAFFCVVFMLVSLLFTCKGEVKLLDKGFSLSVDAPVLANASLILSYENFENNRERVDFKIDNNGRAKVQELVDVKANTFCRMIIKGKTYKSKSIKDYSPGSYIFFFVSNGMHLNIAAGDIDGAGAPIYRVEDDKGNRMNKELNNYNTNFWKQTMQFRIAELELNTFNSKYFRDKPNLKDARKALKKNQTYLEILDNIRKEKSSKQFIQEYIAINNNELSAYFLYYLYQGKLVINDFVRKQIKQYSRDVLTSSFAKQVLELLKKREEYAAGKYISELKETTIKGEPFDIRNVDKEFILLDFWATWCGPCKAGMPKMKEFHEQNKDKLEMVGICCSDKESNWRRFFEKHSEYNWIQLLDSKDELAGKFNVEAYPTKILLNSRGEILYRIVGESSGEYHKLRELISDRLDN